MLTVHNMDSGPHGHICDVVVILAPWCCDRIIDEVLIALEIRTACTAEHKRNDVTHGVIAPADQDEITSFEWRTARPQGLDNLSCDAKAAGATQAHVSKLCADILELDRHRFHAVRVAPSQHAVVVVEGNWRYIVDIRLVLVPAGRGLHQGRMAARHAVCQHNGHTEAGQSNPLY